jgi:GntP family gluconate:H+ symporter
MHGLMPPHPGPVVAVAALKADTGMVLLWGFIIGIPIAFLAGPVFAKFVVSRVPVQTPPMPDLARRTELIPPPFGLTLFSILLPVTLMLLATVAELLLDKGSAVTKAALFVGHPTMALLIAVLFATWSLGTRCGYSSARLLTFSEECIATVGVTLLVVGGGGGFARVLNESGVARALGALATQAHLPPLLYGWLVAAFIRVATGSSTVAITAASGLLVPVIAQHPEVNVELLIIAVGCGSLFLSHLNDGGFWIVKECLGLTVNQTLRTWTITETIIGIAGLVLTLGVHSVWQFFHH